jgi:hypothetical protein
MAECEQMMEGRRGAIFSWAQGVKYLNTGLVIGITPLILNLRTTWRQMDSFSPWLLFHNPMSLLMRLGGTHSLSGNFRQNKNVSSLLVIELRIIQLIA